VQTMGPDEIDEFERRTFAAWDRASLGDLHVHACPTARTVSSQTIRDRRS